MTFKILTGRSPHYLEKLFSISQNDNYNLRSNQTKLKLPKPKTNFLKKESKEKKIFVQGCEVLERTSKWNHRKLQQSFNFVVY